MARLIVAWEACELAEAARRAVSVQGSHLLTDADQVLEAARRFSQAVEEFARLTGTDWQPPTSSSAAASWWRVHLREHAEETAEDLDDCVLRHQDGDPPAPAPVSSHLHF